MSITRLVNTPESILYNLPLGKPNTAEHFTGIEDLRSRIPQPAQKGPNCVYYAFNYLRQRIGKLHAPEFAEARAVEKTISTWRKTITHAYETRTSLENPGHLLLKALHVDFIPLFIASVKLTHPSMSFCDFWNQTKTQKERDSMLEHTQKMWDLQDKRTQRIVFQKFAIHTMIKKYDLTPSPWAPTQPFKNLLTTLSTHGPMAISGKIGYQYYTEPPRLSQNTITGLDIPYYYFPKGSTRKDNPDMHAIILIGAEKKGTQDLVYFIDPMDESDLSSSRKVYVSTYQTIISSMPEPLTINTSILIGEKVHVEPQLYGVHAPLARHSTWSL